MDDDCGQITETHSISAGLDYPGVGPEHAWLNKTGRAKYVGITDEEALQAFHTLTRSEGQHIIVNLSGRGDKDVHTIAALEGISL